jgi:hypothetical protein
MPANLLGLVCAVLVSLPLAARSENNDQLVDRYTALAGSKQNAKALVAGLREGKEVTLSRSGTTATFTPPTGKMGYGNVDIALALAEASLKEKGITRPTPVQLEGTVMEILKLRADGKGWGQIAQSHGYKLGDVKRADKPERAARSDGAGRPERAAKPEKPERVARAERPEKPAKPK